MTEYVKALRAKGWSAQDLAERWGVSLDASPKLVMHRHKKIGMPWPVFLIKTL